MANTTLLVFSVIRNIEDYIRTGKEMDLFKKSHGIRFQKSSKYYADNAKRLYNDIENGYYSLKELAVYLLYRYMIDGKKVNLYKIKPEHILEVAKLFTEKRRKEDLKLLKQIHDEIGFKKGICDYFHVKEDGTSIAYVLTKNGKISPTFFIRNYENCLTKTKKDDIINYSKEHEQFIEIAFQIKKIL